MNGNIDPVGLYDMDRNIRAAGRKYKQLISDWRDVLPAQSVCLQVPVKMPSEYDECPEDAERQEAEARQMSPVPMDGTGATTR